MIRTGWLHHHLHERDPEQRAAAVRALTSTGLEPSHETVSWLWDNRFSVIGLDNVAVEVWPASAESPFRTEAERRGDEPLTSHSGLMHRVLIPLLGMALGELSSPSATQATARASELGLVHPRSLRSRFLVRHLP
jgi:hypothetical protein